jgi:hypothetical protein
MTFHRTLLKCRVLCAFLLQGMQLPVAHLCTILVCTLWQWLSCRALAAGIIFIHSANLIYNYKFRIHVLKSRLIYQRHQRTQRVKVYLAGCSIKDRECEFFFLFDENREWVGLFICLHTQSKICTCYTFRKLQIAYSAHRNVISNYLLFSIFTIFHHSIFLIQNQ